jgi:hypothetical protein
MTRAYDQRHPLCPTCGRVQDTPDNRDASGNRKYFGELTHEERIKQHEIRCYWCGAEFAAQFYRVQS